MKRRPITDTDSADLHAETTGAGGYGLQDGMMSALTGQVKKVGGVLTHEETEQYMLGLPLPALSMCYLLRNDVLLFSRSLVFNGVQGSGKSALQLEVMRWFALYGGMALDVENEQKDRPDIRAGIFQFDSNLLKYIAVSQTSSLQGWQKTITAAMKSVVTYYAKHGLRTPMIVGLDSLNGAISEGTAAKIDSEGCASRGYSEEALLITPYLKWCGDQLLHKPMNMTFVQHLKVEGEGYQIKRTTPGAKHIKFSEAFEVEVTRKKYIDGLDQGGQVVGLTIRKNSYGPPSTIDVNYRWWWAPHPQTGKQVQWFAWDWYDASIALLIKLGEVAKTIRNRISDVLDLHPIKSQRRIWSNTLGISQTAPVSYHEAGRLLELNHPEVMVQLYDILHITRRRRYFNGDDYAAVKDADIGEWRPPVEQSKQTFAELNDDMKNMLNQADIPEDGDEPARYFGRGD